MLRENPASRIDERDEKRSISLGFIFPNDVRLSRSWYLTGHRVIVKWNQRESLKRRNSKNRCLGSRTRKLVYYVAASSIDYKSQPFRL